MQMNSSLAYVSSMMGIAFALLMIAFLLFWIAFYKKPAKKQEIGLLPRKSSVSWKIFPECLFSKC